MKKRGFGLMTKERRQEMARLGGITAHKKGKAYKWNSKTAREAGKKGGRRPRSK